MRDLFNGIWLGPGSLLVLILERSLLMLLPILDWNSGCPSGSYSADLSLWDGLCFAIAWSSSFVECCFYGVVASPCY